MTFNPLPILSYPLHLGHGLRNVHLFHVSREEELKHDPNELCTYVHKLFGYFEGAWRATDLVVLTLWNNTGHKFEVIFGSLARGSCAEVDRAYHDGSVLRVRVRGSEPLALADARMG